MSTFDLRWAIEARLRQNVLNISSVHLEMYLSCSVGNLAISIKHDAFSIVEILDIS